MLYKSLAIIFTILNFFMIIFISPIEWVSLTLLVTMLLFAYSLLVLNKTLRYVSYGFMAIISVCLAFFAIFILVGAAGSLDIFGIFFGTLLLVYAIANPILAVTLVKLKAKLGLARKTNVLLKQFQLFWTQAFNFRGITGRNDYWFATIALFIFSLLLGIPLGLYTYSEYLVAIYTLATAIPSLSLTVRRLRDVGKKWTYILIGFIPLIGQLFLLIALCASSQSDVVNTVDIE